MKRLNSPVLISFVVLLALVSGQYAQNAEQPDYLNHALLPEQRAADLVSRMMIAEGQYALSVGSGQPNTTAPSIAGRFKVKGAKTLPE